MYAVYSTHIYMLIAVSGRRARAYIYAHRAQRVKGVERSRVQTTCSWMHALSSFLSQFNC